MLSTQKLTYEQHEILTREVSEAARGQWDHVLSRLVPGIDELISKGPRKHGTCVFAHGGAEDMRIRKDFAENGCVICTCTEKDPVRSGYDVIMRALGVNFREARDMVMNVLCMDSNIPQPERSRPTQPPRPEKDKVELHQEIRVIQAKISKVWDETISLSHPDAEPARRWFKNRGVSTSGIEKVRFHPSLSYYEGDNFVGKFPCIISMLEDGEGYTTTLHRTYITHEGLKPDVDGGTRKLMAVHETRSCNGSVIKLDQPTMFLNVAEGLETALSARMLLPLPTWACVNAHLMECVDLPPSVKFVVVWADKDKGDRGQEAAVALYDRLTQRGVACIAMLPPDEIPEDAKGIDWNDLVIAHGPEHVRNTLLVRQLLRQVKDIMAAHPEIRFIK